MQMDRKMVLLPSGGITNNGIVVHQAKSRIIRAYKESNLYTMIVTGAETPIKLLELIG
jgi:hypothetical protein